MFELNLYWKIAIAIVGAGGGFLLIMFIISKVKENVRDTYYELKAKKNKNK